MKRVITVTRSQREFLAKAFGVTKEMVSYALNFHPVKGQSDLAKKIRCLAVQRGGFELVTAPASEVVHDADNMMRQHFENGWMWEGDKNTGVLELKDEKGDVVERIEHALLTDIKTCRRRWKPCAAPLCKERTARRKTKTKGNGVLQQDIVRDVCRADRWC